MAGQFLRTIAKGFQFIFPFHAAAWEATAEPVRHMLNIVDEQSKHQQVELWRKSMQDQLTTTGITVRICSYSML
jgi:hypothetical protein